MADDEFEKMHKLYELAEDAIEEMWGAILKLRERVAAQSLLTDELAAALKPFAIAADKADEWAAKAKKLLGGEHGSDSATTGFVSFGEIRNARTAIAKHDAQKGA